MAYEYPKYPNEIPTLEDLPDVIDDVSWIDAALLNPRKAELIAVLTELGINPKGAYPSVAARLDDIAGAPIPVGSIVGVHFSAPVPNSEYWGLCDGSPFPDGSFTTGNKPPLTDDRFLMGGSTAGTGGANSTTLTIANMPVHSHAIDHDHPPVNTGYQSVNHAHAIGAHTHYFDRGYTSTNGGYVTWQKGASGAPLYRQTTSSATPSCGGNSVSHYHQVNIPNYVGSSGSAGSGVAFDRKPQYFKAKFYILLK